MGSIYDGDIPGRVAGFFSLELPVCFVPLPTQVDQYPLLTMDSEMFLLFSFLGLLLFARLIMCWLLLQGRYGLPNWTVPLGIGFLINNLLVVNNYRDWKTDRDVGKKTLVVLLGKKFGLLLLFFG